MIGVTAPQRVLVTGASGTLGCNVVHQLSLQQPATKLCILMRTPRPELFADLRNVTIETVDLANASLLSRTVRAFAPEAIIHCAASGVRPSAMSYFDFIDMNVTATLNLFRASSEIQDCHFIHISTGLVYSPHERPCREEDPINTLHPYGATKAAADCLLRAGAARGFGRLTIVRPFSFTGLHDGGGRLFPSLLQCASEGRPFEMSPGTQLRDFCAVEDVVDAIATILQRREPPSGEIFNVGSGLSVALGALVESVAKQLNLHIAIHPGAKPFHPLEPQHFVADIRRMRSLGWRPRTNLAYAVWQLARTSFPDLPVTEPERYL